MEDVCYAPCWPDLCQSLPACLDGPWLGPTLELVQRLAAECLPSSPVQVGAWLQAACPPHLCR